MELTDGILNDIKEAIGLSSEASPFDTEILMHINGAIGELNQNGVGMSIEIDNTTTWGSLQDPQQVNGNKYFNLIPLFIKLQTKLLFDPPPPSSVAYHADNVSRLLWRLKIAYEEPYIAPTDNV